MDRRRVCLALPAAATVTLLATVVPLAAQSNDDCLGCHDIEGLEIEVDGVVRSLYVDGEAFEASVHGAFDCISCHLDLDGVEEWPHESGLERVQCADCHDDDDGPFARYWQSSHGQLADAGDERAPLCQDCHGDHAIGRLADPTSPLAPLLVGTTCGRCHDAERDRLHADSLLRQGVSVSATCVSCHGGHAVLPAEDPASSLHRDNVDATCRACHGNVPAVHRDVVAAERWEEPGATPACVECHAPHEARRVLYGEGLSDTECRACHDVQDHERSIHGRSGVACAQCHRGVAPGPDRPCTTVAEHVDCAVCHAAPVADHARGTHGQLVAEGEPNAPTCVDCHGTHGILEHAAEPGAPPELAELVRSSPTHRRNVPELCARCHREGAPAADRYRGAETHIIEHYTMSIHGKGLLESGLTVTAVCTDCHTPHKELPHTDPESTVHGDNIADTCGQCHDGIQERFATSVHSPAGNPDYVALRDMPELPHCNDCHSSHGMERTDLPGFKLGIIEHCGECHAEITETYFETYHGKASALGDTTRAKCYDCHGAHDIFRQDDPRSHLSEANIVGTCAECHPRAHPGFTTFLAHATHTDRERYPGLFWSFWGMTGLLVGVFSFFGLHVLLWLPRSWKLRKQHQAELAAMPTRERQFLRFGRFYRGLHLIVILSFFGLALTGMMLKFSHAPWARGLAWLFGGIEFAGWVHRFCAILTFGYMTAHLIEVVLRFQRGGKTVRDFLFDDDSILPKLSDVREFWQTLNWFVGRGPRPNYGRWTYWEKFDYFAVFWGVAIIGSTGLFLWFPELFTRVLPGWAVNVATIIHSDEALLATGFIFTIHFFNTHFRPEKFPMDPVIFTGRMRVKELRSERPRLYEQLVASGELEKRLVQPASDVFVFGVRLFAFTALAIGLTVASLIVWALLFG